MTPRSIRTLAAVSTAVLAVLALAFHLTTTQATHDPGAMAEPQSAVAQSQLATGAISGTVTDSQAQPIAGASVVAQGACSPCVTSTASNGSFVIADLPPGPYTLYAIAFGHQPRFWTSSGGTTERASAETIEVTTGATAIADFILPRYTTISGHVTNRNGETIAGAFVSAQNLEIGGGLSSETDASGHYEISLEETGHYRLAVATSDYLFMFWTSSGGVHNYLDAEPIPVPDVLEESLTGYDVALPRLSSISGRVTDNAGNPINNLSVSPYPLADDCFQCIRGQTDANGEYRLTVEPGRYWVFIQGGWFQDEWWNSTGGGTAHQEEVVVGLEENIRISDVQLSRLGIITGTIRDPEGNPLQDALVSAEAAVCCAGGIDLTDENGEYTIMGLLPRDYVVNASLTGYRTAYWTPAGSVLTPDDAEPVGSGLDTVVSGIDLTLLPKGSISGRVTDTNGTGIPGAGVVASANDFQCCEFWSAPADDDGYYRIVDLETGDYKLYGNAGSGYALGFYTSSGGTTEMVQAEAVHVEFGLETYGADFHLLRYGSISGRVTDFAGDPVPGASVQLYHPSCACTAPYTYTDADGYYVFQDLDPVAYATSEYGLYVYAAGFLEAYWSPSGTVLSRDDAGILHVVLDVVLDGVDVSLSRPGSISGRVVDNGGNPIQGATVAYSGPTCAVCGTAVWTDANGEYQLKQLPPGGLRLYAYRSGVFVFEYWTPDGGTTDVQQAVPIAVSDGENVTGIDFSLLPIACAPYDATGDTQVDVRDVEAVRRAMGSRPEDSRWNAAADVNRDGRVDGRDLHAVRQAITGGACR